jgi:glycosyltransferase involved in cell wall biosynthesis
MRRLRVCIFTETYYPVVGGGETQARLLAEHLVNDGFSVIVVTRRSDAALKRVERYGEVTVYRLPPTGAGQTKKWGLLITGLPALIKHRRQYDLIFVSGFRIIGMAAVLAGKLCGKAVVLKADSQGEMSGEFFTQGLKKMRLTPSSPPFSWFLWGRNQVLKRADAFTYITRDVRTELVNEGIAAVALYDIPNSVDTARFFPPDAERQQAMRRKTGLPPRGKIVVYTGRLVSYKGLPLLLKVWKEITAHNADASLLLVGTGGLDIHNCEAQLKAYVEENDLHQRVFFTGSVQNVPDYLQAADVFVLPTEEDAFPGALIEAMACRLPVITTPVGAIKTVIKDGVNGLLVQPGDFGQLHDALTALLANCAFAAQLGEEGRQTVQDQYSAVTVTRQYEQLFQSLAPDI